MSAVQNIGCHECAWGKVLGCWRCGSRIAMHEVSAQLRARSAEPQPVLPPRDFEPHCLMSWRESVAGMDDASEYADKHKEAQ